VRAALVSTITKGAIKPREVDDGCFFGNLSGNAFKLIGVTFERELTGC
jgi:hypothetical protein